MERALIIGASGGIGSAVALALEGHGAEVVRLSRTVDGLDVADQASVDRVLGTVDGPFDLVLIATGALEIGEAGPEKSLKEVSASALAGQFAVNAIGPALILRHVPRLLPRERPSVCATLTARVGSIGDNRLGGWYGYRAAKAAANQIVHTASIEIARTHPKAAIVALHPGTVATAFTEKYLGRHPSVPPNEAAQNLLNVVSGLTAEHTGQFFDWAGKEVAW